MNKENKVKQGTSSAILPMQCYAQPSIQLFNCDNRILMKTLADESVDVILTQMETIVGGVQDKTDSIFTNYSYIGQNLTSQNIKGVKCPTILIKSIVFNKWTLHLTSKKIIDIIR